YSYGLLPIGVSETIGAVVNNVGALAQTNVPVTANVTGSNSYTNMQTIASLAGCSGQAIATFSFPFAPGSIGFNTLTVSVPADDNTANNSVSKPVNTSSLSYSYKFPGTTEDG